MCLRPHCTAASTARNTVGQLVPKIRATSLQLNRLAQRAKNHA
jgi:hypothetical protein